MLKDILKNYLFTIQVDYYILVIFHYVHDYSKTIPTKWKCLSSIQKIINFQSFTSRSPFLHVEVPGMIISDREVTSLRSHDILRMSLVTKVNDLLRKHNHELFPMDFQAIKLLISPTQLIFQACIINIILSLWKQKKGILVVIPWISKMLSEQELCMHE